MRAIRTAETAESTEPNSSRGLDIRTLRVDLMEKVPGLFNRGPGWFSPGYILHTVADTGKQPSSASRSTRRKASLFDGFL